jgi:hypothetical protein
LNWKLKSSFSVGSSSPSAFVPLGICTQPK